MSKLVFIKLGGSVLTDKTQPEVLHTPVLTEVARTLAQVHADQPELQLLIGHGGGSFGHYWAKHYNTQAGITDGRGWQGFARVQDAMGRLNRVVVAALIDVGLNAVSIQPSAGIVAASGDIVDWDVAAIQTMLAGDLVPVVHGDVVVDRAQGAAIVSTETVFTYLVPQLQPQQIVLIGESGVWTADPHRDPLAVRISVIDRHNVAAVLTQTGGSHGVDVTGGMASKVAAMWQLVERHPAVTVHFVGPMELAQLFAGSGAVGTVMRLG